MSMDLHRNKREILSDPVTAYSSYRPNAEKTEIATLNELWQQAQSLQQQHKEIKASSKKLSRKIGVAKRNNESVDQLVSFMHELSARLKTVKSDLAAIESQILDYFRAENGIIDQAGNASSKRSGRSYRLIQSDISDVSIMPLGDDSAEWNSYVSDNSAATIYHRAEWKELVEKSYGLESHYLLARYPNNNIAGILPLIRLKSLLFGDYLVSLPYFMCAGAVADHPSIELKLMQAVSAYAAGEGIDHIEYRDAISHPDFPVRTDKVNMVLQLPDSPDKLWKRFTPKLRSQIRRPQRENPQISFGRLENLDDFYTVYARNMRDLGSPVHSKKLIRNILQSFPENSWIVVLHLDDKPVGGGLLLQHAGKIDIPLASTIRDFNPIGINMLMYWEILKFSISKGCTQFDFGRSSKDSGTYRFKQQWGAKPHQLYVHYWLKSGNEMPSLNPSNPKYAAAINVWKHLPVSLTKWIGPPIVKALP